MDTILRVETLKVYNKRKLFVQIISLFLLISGIIGCIIMKSFLGFLGGVIIGLLIIALIILIVGYTLIFKIAIEDIKYWIKEGELK